MGSVKHYPPCLQIIAAFSREESVLEWLWKRVVEQRSPIALLSPIYPFVESMYYRSTMGDELKKQFAVLVDWYDPANLSADKLGMDAWERELSGSNSFQVQRPVNIDPGYMSLTKLVLASTKNREHRIYLRDGIYAEVTLAFREQQWQPMPWTYPDYQRPDFRVFFLDARKHLAKKVSAFLRKPIVPTCPDSSHE
jgi:hypothetical protein